MEQTNRRYYLVFDEDKVLIVSNQEPKDGDSVLTNGHGIWEFRDETGTGSAPMPYWANKNACNVIVGSNKSDFNNVFLKFEMVKELNQKAQYIHKPDIKRAMLHIWDLTLKYQHSDINLDKTISDYLKNKSYYEVEVQIIITEEKNPIFIVKRFI